MLYYRIGVFVMLYEKKMLILSGEGSGVVLLEKSGLGVRFALRVFGLKGAGLKAGIITPKSVFVRDLPNGDPSTVFYLDCDGIAELHFAVFDRELRLYGAIGKRMWEANLMDLLRLKAGDVSLPKDPVPALPPIAKTPDVLPMPDGTGIPQSRVAIYGDEAIAEGNFYTPFDLSSRMPEVDSFLDSPRILDGLAPRVTPHRLDDPSVPPVMANKNNSERVDPPEIAPEPEPESAEAETCEKSPAEEVAREEDEKSENNCERAHAGSECFTEPEPASEPDPKPVEAERSEKPADEFIKPHAEAAAVVTETREERPVETTKPNAEAAAVKEAPWQMTARWIREQATRQTVEVKRSVPPVKKRTDVKKLREAGFFEKCGEDVEKLFSIAKSDGEMKALLPDAEWVKVSFSGGVVSVGRGHGYICYAVPGKYEKTSPLGDEAQWLPKLKSAPTGKGYWLIFQDSRSGEIVRSV